MSALDAILTTAWAMEEGALARMLDIAARQHEVAPEALEAYRAQALDRADKAKARDGVAILTATGPLFQRANLMTALSGATSYDILRRDLQAALDDPTVNAILFNIDSPGGAANGTGELAEAVFDARGQKPIYAYVGGMGASAAYWLASAADRIVVDPTALLGSIGVQMAMQDDSEAKEKRGVKTFRFVSSQSPMKNADPGTPEGADHVQSIVDGMAQVFVQTVARNRGVRPSTVLSDFGGGRILVGAAAVKAGLADELGSFESTLAALRRSPAFKSKATAKMTTSPQTSAAVAEAVAAERAQAVAAIAAREPTPDELAARIVASAGWARGNRPTAAPLAAPDSVEALAAEIVASRKLTASPPTSGDPAVDAMAGRIAAHLPRRAAA